MVEDYYRTLSSVEHWGDYVLSKKDINRIYYSLSKDENCYAYKTDSHEIFSIKDAVNKRIYSDDINYILVTEYVTECDMVVFSKIEKNLICNLNGKYKSAIYLQRLERCQYNEYKWLEDNMIQLKIFIPQGSKMYLSKEYKRKNVKFFLLPEGSKLVVVRTNPESKNGDINCVLLSDGMNIAYGSKTDYRQKM